MKKRMGIGLCMLCALLAAAGCGKGADKETDANAAGNVTVTGAPTDTLPGSDDGKESGTEGGEDQNGKAFDKDIISDMYALDGVLEIVYDEDGESDMLEYSIHIPQIDEDTEGARKINELILDSYGAVAQEMIAAGDRVEGYENIPAWFNISYKTYWNGSMVSIVINSQDWFIGEIVCDVCNYDAATGERITNEQLLAVHQIAESDFETLAKITQVKAFDEMFDSAKEYAKDNAWDDEYMIDFYAMYMQCRMESICDENININMPLYLNENGELCVAVTLYTPAGAGLYYEIRPLARDVSEWERLKKIELPDEYMAGAFHKILLGLYGESGFDAQEEADGSIYYFGFDSTDASVFVFQKYEPNGDTQNYSGKLRLSGMDRSGYLFEYEFITNNGNPVSENDLHGGSFYLRRYYDYEPDEYYEEYAIYRWVSGDHLFGGNVDEQKLRPAFG